MVIKNARTWLIATQVLYGVSLLPWVALAAMAFMAFDAGPSTTAWLIAGTVWAYPLAPLFCSVAAWILYRKGRTTGAVVATLLPLVYPVVVMLIFAGLIATGH
ncbi:MAG: hypothetical protein NTY02_16215 [Acidobacteria bacterium]|nr:hypothetical protein [Acidobacteriota bacterium]